MRTTLTLTLGAGAVALLAACANPPPATDAPPYGPLKVNLAHGADFYITQNGRFAPGTIRNGVIVVHLARQPFQSSTLSDETTAAPRPLDGYAHAWQINELLFVQPGKNLETVRDTLFGYIVVYHHYERSNSDIMPIELVFPDR